MVRLITLLLSAQVLLTPVLGWAESILVPDHHSRNKVVRVYSDGRIESVFPPVSEQASQKWKGINQVAVAPNQLYVAYSQDNDIWLYDVDRKTTLRVTRVGKPYTRQFASVEARVKRWSSDGSKLLYEVTVGDVEDPEGYSPALKERKAERGLFEYDLRTDSRRSIKLPKGIGWVSAWFGNGDFLLRVDEQFVRYSPSKKESKPLTPKLTGLDEWQVDVSRDERWMISTIDSSGRMKNSALVKFDLENGKAIKLTPDGNWTEFQFPKFSPSGERISYVHRIGTSPARRPLAELVVDGKALYAVEGYVTYFWVDESTLVLVAVRASTVDLVVIDAGSGAVKASQDWE